VLGVLPTPTTKAVLVTRAHHPSSVLVVSFPWLVSVRLVGARRGPRTRATGCRVTALAIVLVLLAIALHAWSIARWVPDDAVAFGGQRAVPWWVTGAVPFLVALSVVWVVPIGGDPGRNVVLRLAWIVVLVVGLDVVRRAHNRRVGSRLSG
jgi:hypothetical protein